MHDGGRQVAGGDGETPVAGGDGGSPVAGGDGGSPVAGGDGGSRIAGGDGEGPVPDGAATARLLAALRAARPRDGLAALLPALADFAGMARALLRQDGQVVAEARDGGGPSCGTADGGAPSPMPGDCAPPLAEVTVALGGGLLLELARPLGPDGPPPAALAALRQLAPLLTLRLEAGLLAQAAAALQRRQAAVQAALRDVAMFQDISHRIRGTGHFRFNLQKGESWWSPQVYRHFGHVPGSVTPDFTLFRAGLHPDDRARVMDEIAAAVQAGQDCFLRYRTLRPDGRIHHILSLARARGDGWYIGTNLDITDRQEAEQALRRTEAELMRVSRLSTLGELATAITHEIAQPLTAIITQAGATLRWLDADPPATAPVLPAPMLPARVLPGLEAVLANGRRAAAIVAGLRALARQSAPAMAETPLDPALREVVALAAVEASRLGIVLRSALQAPGLRLRCDRVQIQQLVLSLIMAGLQRPGARDVLVVSEALPGQGVRIAVTHDGGPGADELSLCHSIAEAHGAALEAGPAGFALILRGGAAGMDFPDMDPPGLDLPGRDGPVPAPVPPDPVHPGPVPPGPVPPGPVPGPVPPGPGRGEA